MKVKLFIFSLLLVGCHVFDGLYAAQEVSGSGVLKRKRVLTAADVVHLRRSERQAERVKKPEFTVDYYKAYLAKEHPSFANRIQIERMMGVTPFEGLVLSILDGENLVRKYCKAESYDLLGAVDSISGLKPYMVAKKAGNKSAMKTIEKIASESV